MGLLLVLDLVCCPFSMPVLIIVLLSLEFVIPQLSLQFSPGLLPPPVQTDLVVLSCAMNVKGFGVNVLGPNI